MCQDSLEAVAVWHEFVGMDKGSRVGTATQGVDKGVHRTWTVFAVGCGLETTAREEIPESLLLLSGKQNICASQKCSIDGLSYTNSQCTN